MGFTITNTPVTSISDGHTQNHTGTRNSLLAPARAMNWLTAPSIMSTPSTYISDFTNTPGMMARVSPSSMLPMPTSGNGGRGEAISRPSASYSSAPTAFLRALRYVAHDITPDTRNITPMAMVIQ